MGTDIHGVFQRHNETKGTWEDVPSQYEFSRHYQLFAVLAGVRNGRGFAGIKTGEPVQPIAQPRGLPADFTVDDQEAHPIASLDLMTSWRQKYYEQGEPLEIWMGDHTWSWLTGEEMLAWFKNAPAVLQTGVLSREEYDKWDKVSRPESYCGNIWGASIVQINDDELSKRKTPDWTHIRCHWDTPLQTELDYFFKEVERLMTEHGKIRFVFGFDS